MSGSYELGAVTVTVNLNLNFRKEGRQGESARHTDSPRAPGADQLRPPPGNQQANRRSRRQTLWSR